MHGVPEDERIVPVVEAKLELGQISGQMLAGHLMEGIDHRSRLCRQRTAL